MVGDNNSEASIPKEVFEEHPLCFALVVEGDCMSPTINEGDIVVIDPVIARPLQLSDVVALEHLGIRHLCRIYVDEYLITMFHDNPAHRNVIVPVSQVALRGIAVWVIRCVEKEKAAFVISETA